MELVNILSLPIETVIFIFQTKEVAVNIQSVPIGTVIFEDISVNKIQGSVQRTLKNSRRQSDPLGGRISYESAKG